MSKKLLFLMVLVVLMVAGTSAYAGVLLSADWDSGLGTSWTALTDGGVFSNLNNGVARMEVFAPDHPALNNNNYMAVWLDGWHWRAVHEQNIWPNDIEDIYFRLYIRVKPHGVAPDYIHFTDGHFVQNFQDYDGNGSKNSRNTWVGIQSANATTWTMYGPGQIHSSQYGSPYNMFKLYGLPVNEWLRIEQHVHFIRALEVPRPNYTGETNCPSRTYFRVYDSDGVLIADDNDVYLGNIGIAEYTIPEWYAMGRYLWRGGNGNSWHLGQNGPYSAAGYAGRCVDYAALEIRDDTWPGPIGWTGSSSPELASNPSPVDGTAQRNIETDLSWTAGLGAQSHDVYFGTSLNEVTNATHSNLAGDVDGSGLVDWDDVEVLGQQWLLDPTGLNPCADLNADNIANFADLAVIGNNWNKRIFKGNQTTTTFDPGTLDYATTYYWRIDEINTIGTTTGTVWSFTTGAAGSSVTEEFGDAVTTNHPGTVEDIWFGKNGNPGDPTSVRLNTYTWPVNTVANMFIIKWDLSAIPTDATIVDATLYLYQEDSGNETIYDIPVHKIINVDPDMVLCTWDTYDGTNSWPSGPNPLGDVAAAETVLPVDLTNNQYKLWTVTNMVADWVAAPASNYGMLVNSDDNAVQNAHRYFASSEAVDASTRPRLVITYITAE